MPTCRIWLNDIKIIFGFKTNENCEYLSRENVLLNCMTTKFISFIYLETLTLKKSWTQYSTGVDLTKPN